MEHAFTGQDVSRRPAADHAYVKGRIGRREARVERAFLVGPRQPADLAHDVGGDGDRVGAERRQGGMGFMARDQRPEGGDALVGVRDRHHRRFADNDRGGNGLVLAEPGDDVPRAEAGGLLVVAQHDMDRPLQACVDERRRHRQHAGVEALHVAGPAAKEPPGPLGAFRTAGWSTPARRPGRRRYGPRARPRHRPAGRWWPGSPPCRRPHWARSASRARASADTARRSRRPEGWRRR